MDKKDKDLNTLRELEESAGVGEQSTPPVLNPIVPETSPISNIPDVITHQNPNVNQLDGYIKVERYDLPQHGILYPPTWEFAYKCPTAGDVAIFSTLHEQDQPAIMSAIDDIIRKNVYVYDSSDDRLVSSGEICDAHKVYFLLRLREFYLSNYPIKIDTICETCHEPYQEDMTSASLLYDDIPEKLLSAYDGRTFTLTFKTLQEPIIIRIPTLDTTSKIFKHIVRVYRDKDKERKGASTKTNKIFYDKKFLLLAPYLFETGTETINDVVVKFNDISKNDELFRRYNDFITRVHLENNQDIDSTCKHCGSLEEAQIKFPSWNKLFINDEDDSGYYD
jgi:hypothetical protein